MYTVIGKERKEGVYEGNRYDNTYLHCTYDKKSCEGYAVITFKGKTDDIGAVDLGDTVTPHYDRYGNVIACVVE